MRHDQAESELVIYKEEYRCLSIQYKLKMLHTHTTSDYKEVCVLIV